MRYCCALPSSILVSQHISSPALLLAAPKPATRPVYLSPVPRHCTPNPTNNLPRLSPRRPHPRQREQHPSCSPCAPSDTLPRLPRPTPRAAHSRQSPRRLPRPWPLARNRITPAIARPACALSPASRPRRLRKHRRYPNQNTVYAATRSVQRCVFQSYPATLAQQEASCPRSTTHQGIISRHGSAKRPRCSGHEKVCEFGVFPLSSVPSRCRTGF